MAHKIEAVGFCFRSPTPYWWGNEPDSPQNSLDFKSLFEATCERVIEDRFAIQIHRNGIVSIFLEQEFDAVSSFTTPGDDIIDELLSYRAEAIRYLNALSLCINSAIAMHAGFDPGATLVAAENLLRLSYDDQGNLTGASGPGSTEFAETLRGPVRDKRVDIANLDASLALFELVFSKREAGALDLVALLNEALCAYKGYNFPLCVVAGWSVCERLQSLLWQDYIQAAGDAGRIRLTSDVRRSLSRDYSASVVATILQLAGALTVEIAEQLQNARSARNSWLHTGKRPSRLDAASCIETAIELLGGVLGLRLSVGMTLALDV